MRPQGSGACRAWRRGRRSRGACRSTRRLSSLTHAVPLRYLPLRPPAWRCQDLRTSPTSATRLVLVLLREHLVGVPPHVAVDAARVHRAELRGELVAADLSRDGVAAPEAILRKSSMASSPIGTARQAATLAPSWLNTKYHSRASVVGSANLTSTVARSDDRTSGSASSSS